MSEYITCPHCGTPQRRGARRCVYCKAPLPATPGAMPPGVPAGRRPAGGASWLPVALAGLGLASAFLCVIGLICVLAGLAGTGGGPATAGWSPTSPFPSPIAAAPTVPVLSTTAPVRVATSTIAPTRRPATSTARPTKAPSTRSVLWTATARPTTTLPTATRQSAQPTPADTRNPLLFMDEFDDNRNGWSMTYGRLETGELHIHTTEAGKSWLSVCSQAGEFDTFSYEVQARKVEGDDTAGYGLIFRAARDNRELYAFLVCGAGSYILSKWDHDQWVDVITWQDSAIVHGGNSKNKLVVSCYENFFDILVNDEVVISHAVDDFRSNGRIGLLVSYGAHVAFDSVRVWRR